MASRDQLLNDEETALRTALQGWQAGLWTSIPGIVEAVDLTKMTCQVQPSIQGEISNPDGSIQTVNLPLLVDVPIVFPAAGGFALTLPLAVNDEVLVMFSARCIDSWWQSGGVGAPAEARMHDLSDGFAIPGPKSQPHVLPSISSADAQLRNTAGTAYVGLSSTNLIQLVNAAGSGKTILQGMLTLLNNLEVALGTFATATASATTVAQVAAAATTLAASITTLQVALATYKTTTIPGVFQ